ncbi:Rz-like lysis system protein LysB [Kluyvera cryocrescens]|uniref:Rz-like lysis system protein LysB n=1 Tax=Kluyvera cryocrescens TaxID=580 RepID=UPI0039F5D14F
MRLLAAVIALVLALLGWQSWQLNKARQTIELQGRDLEVSKEKQARASSQLIALSILTEANNREQARLYAAAEESTVLLRQRQRRIEELKRENEDLRRWSDTPLPPDVIRMRERPALAGGAAYREWLSESNAVSPGKVVSQN